jgi:hypothetical protein
MQKVNEMILQYANELRGTFTGREFREIVAGIIESNGIEELPSEEAMKQIIKYLTFIAPKMSLNEIRFAFELFTAGIITVFTPKNLTFNLRLVADVVNKYDRKRQGLQIAQQQNAAMKEKLTEQPKQSSRQWYEALIEMIEKNKQLPVGYNWIACIDYMIEVGIIDYEIYIQKQKEEVERLEHISQIAASREEKLEIIQKINSGNYIRMHAAKAIITEHFKPKINE